MFNDFADLDTEDLPDWDDITTVIESHSCPWTSLVNESPEQIAYLRERSVSGSGCGDA